MGTVSILYIIAGLGIVSIGTIAILTKDEAQVVHLSSDISSGPHRINSYWWYIGFMSILFMIIEDTAKVHLRFSPLDYTSADMLPVIKVMCERYLLGEPVYAIIPEIWGGMKPIYLPSMWMPFVIAEVFDFDLRWITIIMAWIATGLAIKIAWQHSETYSTKAPVILLAILLWSTILHLDFTYITLTEEGVVLGYYGLLSYALCRGHMTLAGISTGLCLTSRYSMLPWFLCFVIFLILIRSHEKAIKISIAATVTCLLVFLLSGSYTELPNFIGQADQYLTAILTNKSKYDPLIQESLGLAKFWSYANLGQLHSVFKVAVFVVPAGFLCFWIFLRRTSDINLIGLLGLKLTLVVFYNLLIMPYSYLFYTSTIVSLFVVAKFNLFTFNKSNPDYDN